MNSTKKDFPEGTWFSVPLRKGGYALGLVARTTGKGIVFGYFFGPKADSIETLVAPAELDISDAILIGQFGDRGFLKGTWQKICQEESWDRDKWPMPPFIRVDEVASTADISIYDDDFNLLKDEPCDITLADKYPRDALMGCGAVEIKLTEFLDNDETNNKAVGKEDEIVANIDQPKVVWHYIYFPTKESGKAVAQDLTAKGFAVEDRLGADKVNWLVLAKHEIVPTEESLHQLRSFFESLAAEYGGEYDGWEAAV